MNAIFNRGIYSFLEADFGFFGINIGTIYYEYFFCSNLALAYRGMNQNIRNNDIHHDNI